MITSLKRVDQAYKTFEFHTISLAEHYAVDVLESRSLLIDRPRYNFQESLWGAYSCILKSKIEQHYFDETVLVVAEERNIFEMPIQKILHPAYWAQITCLKNFGTIDECTSLYGTVHLKKIKPFFDDIPKDRENTGIPFFFFICDELREYIIKDIGLDKIHDPHTTNKEIESLIKHKFPDLTAVFIREYVSLVRKDAR